MPGDTRKTQWARPRWSRDQYRWRPLRPIPQASPHHFQRRGTKRRDPQASNTQKQHSLTFDEQRAAKTAGQNQGTNHTRSISNTESTRAYLSIENKDEQWHRPVTAKNENTFEGVTWDDLLGCLVQFHVHNLWIPSLRNFKIQITRIFDSNDWSDSADPIVSLAARNPTIQNSSL